MSLQLFNKVDLQDSDEGRKMVQGRHLHFLPFQCLCPQADSLRKTGPLVAAGGVVSLPSC